MKRTPAVGARILLTEDRRGIDTRHLGFTMGPHEECAVEEAVRIAERSASGTSIDTDRRREEGSRASVTVLTVGPPEAAEQVRYALSMGADAGVLAEAPSEECDPEVTAASIVHVVRAMAAEGTVFDLILFGNDSAVAGHGQVGIRVGCALGLPVVGGIKEIGVRGDRLALRRHTATGAELYDVPLPAAVAVKEGINVPRYPTIKGRMRARKATLRTFGWQPAPGGLRTVALRRPREDRPETVLLGTGAGAAPAVVDMLTGLGVV
ncbi:MAG: electron transfer flavoprotein beta subunit/FixA family protein [Pseudonocardia sp.]|nr:electron transfer flavoprotein beta subunit/FixA family protein [Pseudonocardia sp.]